MTYCGSTLQIVHGEARRIRFEVSRRVESHAIKKRFLVQARAAVRAADFLHGRFVKVAAHDSFRYALVVRRADGEAPAAVLSEEPFAILWLRVVTVALAEVHVEFVFLRAAIAIIIVSL